jgi:hypothetical protein
MERTAYAVILYVIGNCVGCTYGGESGKRCRCVVVIFVPWACFSFLDLCSLFPSFVRVNMFSFVFLRFAGGSMFCICSLCSYLFYFVFLKLPKAVPLSLSVSLYGIEWSLDRSLYRKFRHKQQTFDRNRSVLSVCSESKNISTTRLEDWKIDMNDKKNDSVTVKLQGEKDTT